MWEKGFSSRLGGECAIADFPLCSSCSPRCLPVPSVPQLCLSSVALSSPALVCLACPCETW